MTRTRITSPFGARSTARQVIAGRDLSGKRAIVTGAATGIGVETARALAEAGAEVVMAVRDVAKASEIAGPFNSRIGGPRLKVSSLDLSRRASIEAFAEREGKAPLNILINNAGVMACPLGQTADGFEMQFGTNHLGHFLLGVRLASALAAGAKAAGKPARLVSLSSIGHRRSPVVFEDPNYQNRPYDKWESYGQSKTANALFAVGFDKRYAAQGVRAFSVMPGGIMTELQRHLPKEEMIGFGWIDENGTPNPNMKSPEQGAATSVWAAVGPELEGVGGLYLEDCAEAAPWSKDNPWAGVKDYALDPAAADKLWALSEKLWGLT